MFEQLRQDLRQGALPSVVGVVGGVLGSMAVGSLIESVFPNTGGDSVTYALVVPLVVMVVLLAADIPARRAAHIDPLAALRQD